MCHITTFMILLFLHSWYSYTSSHSRQPRENHPEEKGEHLSTHVYTRVVRLNVIDHFPQGRVEISSACWEESLETSSSVSNQVGLCAPWCLRMIFPLSSHVALHLLLLLIAARRRVCDDLPLKFLYKLRQPTTTTACVYDGRTRRHTSQG